MQKTNIPRRRSRFSKILAGIALPATIAFALLTGLIVWRILVLESAANGEDRADEVLVATAQLASNLTHLQSQERGFLLTGSPAAFGNDVTPNDIADGLAALGSLIDDPLQQKQLDTIAGAYARWAQQARILIRERTVHGSTPAYTPARIQIAATHDLNRAVHAFLEEQRVYREAKSMAVDLQVRIVVLCAITGSLIVGALLVFTGWRLVSLDAQQRRREEELEEQNRRMSESARVKGEFVAHMSHEFRTPLTAILGLGELLYDEKVGPLSPVQKRYVDDILNSGRHLLELINQVLDVAKLEAGKLSLRYSSCSPCALARETLLTLQPLADEKQVTLRGDCGRAPATVVTDPARFKQILYNYLSNALTFTPPGGTVALEIVDMPGGRFRIEVCDTGSGIAPSDVPKLFKAFSQVESPAGFSRDGAGLGLALTKRIVEAQGGSVGVESTPGLGSTFYAELPCDPPRAGAAA